MMFLRIAAAAAVLCVAGCDLAPQYDPPSFTTPSQYKTGAKLLSGMNAPEWWRAFRDRELDDLETRLESSNPDLASAVARYDRSRAFLAVAETGLYPTLDFQGSLSENRQSNNRPLRSKGQPNHYGSNQAFGVVSYEFDIWGRIRDRIAIARALSQADQDLLDQTRLVLRSELARDYVLLRGFDLDAQLLTRTLKLYRDALTLTRSRVEGHIAPPIDTERAIVQVANVEAQIAEVAQSRAKTENAIAALIGEPASGFKVAVRQAPLASPKLPRSAPSDLLERRPDIAASERGLYAASEAIGVARSAFFPRFSILLAGGTQDTHIRLTDLANSAWSVGPEVSMPIFDAGLRMAELDAAHADFRDAAGKYRSTVLAAFQEVEDSLAAMYWLARELRALSTSATAAGNASTMALSLYRDGAASFLDVVTAQDAALSAERAEISARTRVLEANVQLMLALGGGWRTQADPSRQASAMEISDGNGK